MDVKTKKIRATLFFMIVVGLLILSASILVHRAISELLVGQREGISLFDFIPIFGDRKVEGVSAAVLVSNQTANYLASVISEEGIEQESIYENYRQQAMFWHKYLQSRKYKTSIISDNDLTTELHNYNLLVLPFTLCLSEEQINAVKFFLEQGKGVVFTHSSGNRDETGIEREGWSLTSDVLGGFPFYIPVRDTLQKTYYKFIGNTPLTINTPPGWRTQVYTYDQPMAMNLIEGRTNESALWAIASKGNPENDIRVTNHTAISYGNYSRGRFIWIGFNPSLIVDTPDAWSVFDRFLNSSIDWVTYKTVAGKANWRKSQGAATFMVSPHRDYVRGLSVLEKFTQNNITPAFLIDYRQAGFHRLTLERITNNGEIAAQVTDVFGENTDVNIERKARQIKTEIETALHTKVYGFEAESINNINYDVIRRANYEYIWANNESGKVPLTKRSNVQSLFRKRRDTVVFLKSAQTDYDILQNNSNIEPDKLLNILINDFETVYKLGGLYTNTFHSHIIGSERYQPVLDEFIRHIKQKDIMIVSPAEMARWWRKHDNINLRIQESPRRITLMITNESREPIESTTVYLFPALLPETLSIRAERINVPIPQYEFNTKKTRIDLTVRNLGSNESRTYYIDFR